MNSPCPFDKAQLAFSGSPVDQARCLLRFVKRGGEVDDSPVALPPVLAELLADPKAVDITAAQLRLYLRKRGIAESTVGGSVSEPVCHADSDNPAAPLARYFVIHDTSTKLSAKQTFDPGLIDSQLGAATSLPASPGAKHTSTSPVSARRSPTTRIRLRGALRSSN